MLFLLVPLHNLTDLNRLLSNNIATAAYSGGYPFSISGDIRSVPS